MRVFFLLWAALCLGGCQSQYDLPAGVPDNNPFAADKDSAAARRHPAIVCFGDSLTSGFNVAPGHSYPDYLQQIIDEKGYEFDVYNEGISGETTSAALVRTEIALTRDPWLVIVAFGANDGLRGLSVERMRSNLRKIIQRIQREDVQVVFAGMKLPPNYGSEYIQEFESVYPTLAKELGVPLIPFLLQGVAANPRYMQESDGLHPNEDGNRKVAQHVFEHIEPLLKQHQAARAPQSAGAAPPR